MFVAAAAVVVVCIVVGVVLLGVVVLHVLDRIGEIGVVVVVGVKGHGREFGGQHVHARDRILSVVLIGIIGSFFFFCWQFKN